MDATDATDELARKLIEAFEPLGEEVILEYWSNSQCPRISPIRKGR